MYACTLRTKLAPVINSRQHIRRTSMHAGRRSWVAVTAVSVMLLAMVVISDAFFSAQFARTTIRNQMGSGVRLDLTCFRKVEDKRWYMHKPGIRWVKINHFSLNDGQGYIMYHPGLPFVQEKIACNFRANWRGRTCSWVTFDDYADSADADADDRTWHLRRNGIYDEITSGQFRRRLKYRYRYCRGFGGHGRSARWHGQDLKHVNWDYSQPAIVAKNDNLV